MEFRGVDIKIPRRRLRFKAFFRKLKGTNLSSVQRKITDLVERLQRTYYGHDPIVSTFTASELISNIDLICRAFSISLTQPKDTNYILSKLSAASRGIDPEDRKEIFLQENLHIGNEIGYWRNNGHSSFYFCAYQNAPYLLIRHDHGTSVMNATEAVLESIQEMFLEEFGFHLVQDNVDIFVKDVLAYYYKVEVDMELTNPQWKDLTEQEKTWFDDQWEHLQQKDGGMDDNSPLFFEKDKPYTAYKHIRRLFKRTAQELFIVDPYVNDDVFSMLEIVPSAVKIRILSFKYQADSIVIAKRFRRERGNFDFRQTNKLHDRYLFCDDHCYLFGSSLNNFGSLPTTIVPMHDRDLGDSVRQYFDTMWGECEPIK